MSRCLVTGATGFVGSHVARALVERGDDVRVTVRAGSPSEPLEGVDVERVKLPDITDRRALRRALTRRRARVPRGRHDEPAPRRRRGAARQRRGHAHGARGGAARRRGARVHTSSVAAIGPAPPGSALDERAPYPGRLGLPYPDSKHAAEVEALRVGARACGRHRQPGARVRAG